MTSQNAYLRRQLRESLKQKRREIRSSSSSGPPGSGRGEGEEEDPQTGGSSSEGGSPRHPRRGRRPSSHFNDFKVDILEFEYKEIPEDKKVKLVALKLRKYTSLWWTNLLTKRVRQGKGRIGTWEKMKTKLKALFLPPT